MCTLYKNCQTSIGGQEVSFFSYRDYQRGREFQLKICFLSTSPYKRVFSYDFSAIFDLVSILVQLLSPTPSVKALSTVVKIRIRCISYGHYFIHLLSTFKTRTQQSIFGVYVLRYEASSRGGTLFIYRWSYEKGSPILHKTGVYRRDFPDFV